jgi:two-component system chemotaxis response regulator CheB
LLNKIRAVVIDDSAFMRKSISIMLESDSDIEVVGTARDGLEGFNLVKSINPDIVTLDIEMPRMDGLTALKKIMDECPTSVIMVSSLTSEGAEATIKALELGAVDFIPKELSYVSINIIKIKDIVRQKAVQLRLKRIQNLAGEQKIPARQIESGKLPKLNCKAIGIGVSTGGPMSLQKVIPKLSQKINCPIFIVQHMPPKFTKSLADRLNSLSNVEVKEAEHNEVVRNGVVYFAPGGFHLTVKKSSTSEVQLDVSENPSNTLHKPSVDVTLGSVVKQYGKNTLGIIMTGMGKDGMEAIKELKNIGGHSIAQDEQSCVVYGMPRAIVDAGLADISVSLDNLANVINETVIS